MAEKLSPEDFQAFLAHLAKYPDADPCPICKQNTWTVSGVEAAIPFILSENRTRRPDTGGKVMPIVSVACRTCGYVRSFSWYIVKPRLEGVVDG